MRIDAAVATPSHTSVGAVAPARTERGAVGFGAMLERLTSGAFVSASYTADLSGPGVPAGGVQTFAAARPAALRGSGPVAGDGVGGAALQAARRYLGTPYVWGGTDPSVGMDCSGMIQRAFADVGVTLPRFSGAQAQAGTAVASMADARPGDLVFWSAGNGRSTNHIGIYAGDGQMLHAPKAGDVVKVGPMLRSAPDRIVRIDG